MNMIRSNAEDFRRSLDRIVEVMDFFFLGDSRRWKVAGS